MPINAHIGINACIEINACMGIYAYMGIHAYIYAYIGKIPIGINDMHYNKCPYKH